MEVIIHSGKACLEMDGKSLQELHPGRDRMYRFGYDRSFALGSIAGSASLGMLIPPSVLLIIWGIVIEQSIGKLFLAGFIPGIILAILMGAYCTIRAAMNKELAPMQAADEDVAPVAREIVSGFGVILLILLVLGGLFAGLFTPSESAAVGCGGAVVFSWIKGLRWPRYREAIIDSGKTIAPIMFLLMTAAMYAKFLALGNIIQMIQDLIGGLGLGPFGVTVLMIVIWLAGHLDRFRIDHPSDRSHILAVGRSGGLGRLRLRDIRDSRYRGWPADAAVWPPGLYGQGGCSR